MVEQGCGVWRIGSVCLLKTTTDPNHHSVDHGPLLPFEDLGAGLLCITDPEVVNIYLTALGLHLSSYLVSVPMACHPTPSPCLIQVSPRTLFHELLVKEL